MMDNPNQQSAVRNHKSSWLPWFFFAVLIVGVALWRSTRSRELPELIGEPLPPLAVAGWLEGGTAPSEQSLRGKLVLVDFWATWCPPCRAAMPKLAEFAHRFRDQDVVVIGLTPESGLEIETVRRYVASVEGMDWPIGYGAAPVMSMLGINMAPTYVLFDRQGVAIWAAHTIYGLEDKVVEELAK